MKAQLEFATLYELMVEMLTRWPKGVEYLSDRQLRILRNFIVAELDRRFISRGGG